MLLSIFYEYKVQLKVVFFSRFYVEVFAVLFLTEISGWLSSLDLEDVLTQLRKSTVCKNHRYLRV